MGGARPPAEPILLPPRGVVGRRSTDVLATEDHELARAIHELREQACSGLRLKDFLRTTSLSQRRSRAGHAQAPRPNPQGRNRPRPARTRPPAPRRHRAPRGHGGREMRIRTGEILLPGLSSAGRPHPRRLSEASQAGAVSADRPWLSEPAQEQRPTAERPRSLSRGSPSWHGPRCRAGAKSCTMTIKIPSKKPTSGGRSHGRLSSIDPARRAEGGRRQRCPPAAGERRPPDSRRVRAAVRGDARASRRPS